MCVPHRDRPLPRAPVESLGAYLATGSRFQALQRAADIEVRIARPRVVRDAVACLEPPLHEAPHHFRMPPAAASAGRGFGAGRCRR